MAQPDVTVIIPTYNPDPAEVQRAIDHAWMNACVARVIVVDDGSETKPDVENAIVGLFGHQGVWATRNAGLDASRGWVIFCDQDDHYAPGAIDALRKAARWRTRYAYGDTAYPLQDEVHRPGEWHPKLNVGQFGARYGVLWHTSHEVRFEETLYNDWDVVLQLEARGVHGVYVPQTTLVHYKRDSGMMSRATAQERQQAAQWLRERWGW